MGKGLRGPVGNPVVGTGSAGTHSLHHPAVVVFHPGGLDSSFGMVPVVRLFRAGIHGAVDMAATTDTVAGYHGHVPAQINIKQAVAGQLQALAGKPALAETVQQSAPEVASGGQGPAVRDAGFADRVSISPGTAFQ